MRSKNIMKTINKKKKICVMLCLCVLLASMTACSNRTSGQSAEEPSSEGQTSEGQTTAVEIQSSEEMFSDRDMEIGYDESTSTMITLSDDGSTVTGDGVKINGNVITIKNEGTYLVSGTLSDGQIIIDAQSSDKLQIVLDDVKISNSSSAPIYVKQADKVFITLANQSENVLTATGEMQELDGNNIDAVIFSKDDLTLNGNGSLTIQTEYGNGITSKDDLVLTSGTYHIMASGHCLEGKDSVRIANGNYTLVSGKDGIHSENSDDVSLGYVYISSGNFHITAQTDGIDAAAYAQIDGGSFTIVTGGGSANASSSGSANASTSGNGNKQWGFWGTQESTDTTDTASAKGIKADGIITVLGGNFTMDSSDDSLHANEDILIQSGTFVISSGDDGVHADSNLTINDGSIDITKSYEGIEAQSIDINGGNIKLVASDDGFNAAGGNDSSALGGRMGQGSFATDENAYINIAGGSIFIDASGDGVDSNGSLRVTGGETYVAGPENSGNGALDYNGTAEITGGVFVAAGASGMAQNFSSATQGSILVSTQSMLTGDVTISDNSGNEILSYTFDKQYNCVVISSPELKEGDTYTVTMGSDTQEVTLDSLVYGNAGMGGMFDGGRGNGGMGRPGR